MRISDMPRQTAYFDSQASAAAALNIDIYELRDAKREGCPAFRSGRVYTEELLNWLAQKRLRRVESAAPQNDQERNRLDAIVRTLMGLSECANMGVLTDEQHFEFGRTIVEASENKEILQIFINVIFGWLFGTFPDLAAARKAHPNIIRWLEAEALRRVAAIKKNQESLENRDRKSQMRQT
jgi:hypothetical protein